MRTPEFFDAVAPIVVADALAALLGAADDGVIEYRYLDAVKLAGHSCPTVAGAWLMTRAALARLYPDGLPRRGEIRVELRESQVEGVAGVVAAVAGLVTGAAGEGGFKGLAGGHVRRGLLRFGVPMAGEMRFTRLDDGHWVETSPQALAVPRPPRLGEQLRAAVDADAGDPARREFAAAWQGWVGDILRLHADDPALVVASA